MFISYFFILFIAFVALISLFTAPAISVGSHSILNGEYALKYEGKFDQSLPHFNVSTSLWKLFKYKLFNEGLDGVVIGKNGWLFTSEELLYDHNADVNFDQNVDYITSVVDQFNKNKINVVVVPVPAKARIYQNQLKTGVYPRYKQGIYQKFTAELVHHNIYHLDLLSVFNNYQDSDLYFKTDTHWTPAATEITAQNILALRFTKQGRTIFKKTEVEPLNLQGDLVQYVHAKSYLNEKLDNFTVTTNSSNANLFGDQYFPIVLVGTSYSADARWGFDRQLKLILKHDILNVSDKGQGPFRVMKEYMSNFEAKDQKTELVIWEIPERYLTKKATLDG